MKRTLLKSPPALGAFLAVALLLALSAGAYPLPPLRIPGMLAQALFGKLAPDDLDTGVLLGIRLPRVLFGALAGAGLALGGVAMQALFRNPLADPGLMGVSSGAALAVAAFLMFPHLLPETLHTFALPLAAFLGGVLVTALTYRGARRDGLVSVDRLLLMGIAANALCGALIGLLLVFAGDTQLRDITFWSFGSLARVDLPSAGALGLALLPAMLLLWRDAPRMNLLLAGEADAACLGLSVESLKRRLIVLSCWMVSLVVALAGIIGFVGLVIPHVSRLLLGPSHRGLVPASLLLGAGFLPLVDALCRTLIAPAELPIGMVTALLGTPIFLLLLLRREAAA